MVFSLHLEKKSVILLSENKKGGHQDSSFFCFTRHTYSINFKILCFLVLKLSLSETCVLTPYTSMVMAPFTAEG